MRCATILMTSCAMLTAACATTPPVATPSAPSAPIATAELRNASGAAAGHAELLASGDTMTLRIAGTGLPAGPHGAHLHMVGRCEAPGFASAGGHLNPAGHQHGTDNPAGSHLGDLPNLVIAADGAGTLTVPLSGPRSTVEAALLDADGSALVIHAAADDYRTDPSGNSGARLACGVLQPTPR